LKDQKEWSHTSACLCVIPAGHRLYLAIFFTMTQQPLLGQDLLIIEDSSHTDSPQSVELLWTSDEPNEETST
jgi:hypothetical protein